MNYLTESFGLFGGYVISATIIFLRYLFFAGTAFSIFYIFKKRKFIKRKIQEKTPAGKQMWYEVRHSIYTAFIFALVGLGIFYLKEIGVAKIYSGIGEHGYIWPFVSFAILLIVNDTWFYWAHRLIHKPKLFRIIHKVHHQSHNPTPWASFSFHPTEAVMEIAFLPVVVCLMPVHTGVLIGFSIFSLAFNVLGHLGYEILPKGFTRHPFFRWFNTPTHHNLHHQKSNCNYGLYFNFWDWAMGTNHQAYHQVFEKIHERKAAA